MNTKMNLNAIKGENCIIHYQLTSKELKERTLLAQLGEVTAMDGAIAITTGKFTGRSPKDRFIVEDNLTKDRVFWGSVNKPFAPDHFDSLLGKIDDYLTGKELFVQDAKVCADPDYAVRLRVICEHPYAALFANNMFIGLNDDELKQVHDGWTILVVPSFLANPSEDHTLNGNFTILNFTKKMILIGGSAYTGEIKKSVFSVLNFLMPVVHDALPMHCSVNEGADGHCAIFFGLSGTGKTTLSSDPKRALIGDDEHAWIPENKVFNFEGGCYAKVINLDKAKEPDIYQAIKEEALLENVIINPKTKEVDFSDDSITENTRVSYPIDYIPNAKQPSVGSGVNHIFFLTADAYGVLPPIARLSEQQAAYYFVSGYTSKVAGTEVGVKDPVPTFSACFGEAFMPLHPSEYATMLMKNVKAYNTKVWLINTGWVGGSFGIGKRIKLSYTRAIIQAALNGSLTNIPYSLHPEFKLQIPETCPNVPDELLNPIQTWDDPQMYQQTAAKLIQAFRENFKKYEAGASNELLEGKL